MTARLNPWNLASLLLFVVLTGALPACQQSSQPEPDSATAITENGSTQDNHSGPDSTSTDEAETAECTVMPPKDDRMCTQQYDPVCGCDGKTYSNACMARIAGVSSSTPGACEGDRTDRI